MSLKDELIEAIRNENNHFNMVEFFKCEHDDSFTTEERISCGTPSCMAGWICHLRKDSLNKELHWVDDKARDIWEKEMGEKCRLDFFPNYNYEDRPKITRQETIDHINGVNKDWPLLGDE